MNSGKTQSLQESHNLRYYAAFGLVIASEIALPDLYLAQATDSAPDVLVRLAPFSLGAAELKPGFTVDGKTALLDVADVGRYQIQGGRDIQVAPVRGVSDRELRLFLLGSAFGALLHQRGVQPLHANAIEIAGRAVAFSGHSGAGKSTLAAWFYDRGYRMISDDVCAITFNQQGRPIVAGGLPRLRLRRDALIASGRNATDYAQSYDGVDKFDVPAPLQTQTEAVPLGLIYMLGRGDNQSGSAGITRLSGVRCVEALIANTYRGSFARGMGLADANLANCLSIVRSTPVFRADRVWGRGQFETEACLLERHAIDFLK